MKVTGCHFVVNLDIYHKEIMFAFGYPKKKVGQLLKVHERRGMKRLRKDFLNYPSCYSGVAVIGKFGDVLIYMPIIPITATDFGTLSHEIFHAVEGVMCYVCNPLQEEGNSESWAHMIGYITQQVQEKLGNYYHYANPNA